MREALLHRTNTSLIKCHLENDEDFIEDFIEIVLQWL